MRLALSLVDTCVCRLPFHYNSFFYTLKRRFATTSFLSESYNNCLYTKRHDWILVRGGVGTVGVNKTALKSLDNIVGVKTPKLGQKLRRDDTVGKILYDSNSLALTICAPVSGTVVERNNAFQSSISLVNQLIGKEGWLYRIQIENKAELKELLNEKAYNKFCCVNIVFTIPNALCIARIAATPFIGYLVVIELFMPACTLFAIAGLTDLLDGWIARRYPSQRSVLGSALDPIADKFLISTLFVTLSYSNLIPVLLTSVVLLRDVLLVVGGFVRRYQLLELPFTIRRFFDPSISSIHITPTLTSKINTVLQLSLVTLSLGSPVFGYENHAFLTALCMCTGATTVFSGLQYASGKAIRPVKKWIEK